MHTLRKFAVLSIALGAGFGLAGCDYGSLNPVAALIDFNAKVTKVAQDIDAGIAIADTTLLPAACVVASDVAAKLALVEPLLGSKVQPIALKASKDLIALSTSPDCRNIAAGGTPKVTLASIVVTIQAITAQTAGAISATAAVKTSS